MYMRASMVAQTIKNLACDAGDWGSIPGLGRSPGEGNGYQLQYSCLENSFPGVSDGKESACNTGDPGSTPGLRRSPGEGNGNPLQSSCLENPMDRGAWRATVLGVTVRHDRKTFTCDMLIYLNKAVVLLFFKK